MANPPRHVIFRSKGCNTCRARKVRCDQTHPFCQRCVRAGIHCAGYTPPTTFVCEDPQSIALSLSAEPRMLPYPAEPKHVAFLVKAFAIGVPGDTKGYSWLTHSLRTSEAQSYLLFASSRCLSQVFYSRHFEQQSALADGMVKYGKMLQVLRGELMKARAVRAIELVQVIMTSILIESIIAPTIGSLKIHGLELGGYKIGGLHAHVDGLARVLQVQSPEAFQQRSELPLFEMCRYYVVGRAISLGTPIFLADFQWKTLPWKYEGKDAFNELWDILCDVPAFFFDLKRLSLASLNWPILEVHGLLVNPAHRLSVKLKDLLQDLFHWRWKWDVRFTSSTKAVPTNPHNIIIKDQHGNPQFQTCLSYSDTAVKSDMIYYQATLVFLLRLGKLVLKNHLLDSVDKAAPSGLALPLRSSPLLRPPEVLSLEDTISEFYRSMEGHLCGSVGRPAAESYPLLFALSLVIFGVEKESVEMTWAVMIRERIIRASGLDMWVASRERIEGSANLQR